MASLWDKIETSPEAAAALVWKRRLGPAFDAAAAVCLRETERELKRIPCANGCKCSHRVWTRGGRLVGFCECGEDCDDMLLTPADVKVWNLDLTRLARAVAKALACTPVAKPFGSSRVVQVAALGNPAVPLLLTIQPDMERYQNTIAQLAVKLPKGFILLTPTKLTDAGAMDWAARASVGLYDLESNFDLAPGGSLHSAKTVMQLFAGHLPEMKDTVLESDKALVWRLFSELMAMGMKGKAPPARVFDLMVFKKLNQTETAGECKCSLALISKQVDLIEDHFHMPIERLRAFASDLKERQRMVKGDRHTKKKQGATRDDPDDPDDDPDAAPKEEYGYDSGSADD